MVVTEMVLQFLAFLNPNLHRHVRKSTLSAIGPNHDPVELSRHLHTISARFILILSSQLHRPFQSDLFS